MSSSAMRVRGCRARVADRLADPPYVIPRCVAASERRFVQQVSACGGGRVVLAKSPRSARNTCLTIAFKAARVKRE